MESPESSNLFASSSSPDFRESEMSSSEFDWKSDKLFEIGLGDNLLCYRVNGAKEIITHVSRNLFEVDFTAWKPSIESYVSEVNGVDLESMWENIDENFPVIFGTKKWVAIPH